VLRESTASQGTLILSNPFSSFEFILVLPVENPCFGRGYVFRVLIPWNYIKTSGVATSAVDLDTDRAIQEIIRGPAFAEVTIFTIALVLLFYRYHTRLTSILDIDSIPLSSQIAS
jgi:hypothetical protein